MQPIYILLHKIYVTQLYKRCKKTRYRMSNYRGGSRKLLQMIFIQFQMTMNANKNILLIHLDIL